MTIRPVSIISTHQTINMAVSHEYDWSAYNDDTSAVATSAAIS